MVEFSGHTRTSNSVMVALPDVTTVSRWKRMSFDEDVFTIDVQRVTSAGAPTYQTV